MNTNKRRAANELPHMYQDAANPGIIRFTEDPTAGFIAGVSAAAIVKACNAYDDLISALREIEQQHILQNAQKGRAETRSRTLHIARAALAKAGAL